MSGGRLERRLAAVVAFDVAGYSRLTERDEESTHRRLQSAMRETVEPRIAEGGGRIVKQTGDGAIAEFASVVEAVRAALAIQHEMEAREEAVPAEQRLQFRIGVNLGDVIVEPQDIYGSGVNIAARVEAFAGAGGICVTQAVADQIADKLEVRLVDLGHQSLKNIARPVRLYEVVTSQDGAVASAAISLGPGARPAIVVLPFDGFRHVPEEEYFADGLTEDLTTMLASWRVFPVIDPSTAFTYKGRNVDTQTLGRELNARYVVKGSVRRTEQRLRITAQLIEAMTRHVLYADRFDGEMSEVFGVQDEIVTSVVGVLEPELLRVERDRAFRGPPDDMTAYDLMQRGLWQHYQYTRQNSLEAQKLFRRALEIAPDYAQCLAALSVTLSHSVMSGWLDRRAEHFEEAFGLAQRAVFIDGRDPLAHFALGLASLHTQRVEMAISENEQAIRINPSYAAALTNLGNCYNYIDRPSVAFDCVSRAMRLSPHDPRMFMWMPALAGSHYLRGNFDEAVDVGRRASAMKPDYHHCDRYVAASLGMMGRPEARELLPTLQALDGSLAGTEKFLGRYFIARSALGRILEGLRRAGFE